MLVISFTLYILRVIVCICVLAALDKWELADNGIRTKTTAMLFAFMPLYLFYLVGKNINEKFKN